MATPPMGPGGPPEFNVPGTPEAGGPSALQGAMNALAESNINMARSVSTLVENMGAAYQNATKLHETLDAIAGKIDSMVRPMDRVEDNFKTLNTLTRELNQLLSKPGVKYGEMEEHLKKQIEETKRLRDAQKEGSAEIVILTRRLHILEDAMNGVATKGNQMKANTQVAAEAMDDLRKKTQFTERAVADLGKGIGRLEMGRLERYATSVNRSFRDAGIQVKFLDRLEEASFRKRAAKELQISLAARRQEQKEDFEQRVKLGKPDKMFGAAEVDYGTLAKQAALRGGKGILGRVDVALSRRALEAGGKGEEAGFIGGKLARLGQMGGGSVLGGAAEAGMGMMGEGAAALMPYAGILTAIYGMAKTFWDTRAKLFSEVEKSLGGALFQPGIGGTQALTNVYENLAQRFSGAGLQLGMTLERNLGIVQAMSDAGLDVSALTERQPAGQGGMLGGTFGRFQEAVAYYGRGAGLTDAQSVQRMIKLMFEMRQTFQQSEDFLANVGLQAKAAGLSVTKYISLIDSLTDHFDKMNKSFETTTLILSNLGATGINTADQMSDMFDAITGATTQKTQAQQVFGMMAAQGQGRGIRTQTEAFYKKQLDTSVSAFTNQAQTFGVGETLANLPGIVGSGDVGRLQVVDNQIAQLVKSGQLKPDDAQALSTSVQNIRSQMMARQTARMELTPGREVEASQRMMQHGKDAMEQTIMQVGAVGDFMRRLGGGGMGMLAADPNKVSGLIAQAMSTLGIPAPTLDQLSRSLGQAGFNVLQQTMAPGQDQAVQIQRIRTFLRYAKNAHVAGYEDIQKRNETEKMSDKDLQEAFGKEFASAKNNAALAYAISQHMDMPTFLDSLTSTLNKDAEKRNKTELKEQVRAVSVRTRTTADLYAQAFEFMFKWIVAAVDKVAKLVESIPGVKLLEGKFATAPAKQQAETNETLKKILAASEKLSSDPTTGMDAADLADNISTSAKDIMGRIEDGTATIEDMEKASALSDKLQTAQQMKTAANLPDITDLTPDQLSKYSKQALEMAAAMQMRDITGGTLAGGQLSVANITQDALNKMADLNAKLGEHFFAAGAARPGGNVNVTIQNSTDISMLAGAVTASDQTNSNPETPKGQNTPAGMIRTGASIRTPRRVTAPNAPAAPAVPGM